MSMPVAVGGRSVEERIGQLVMNTSHDDPSEHKCSIAGTCNVLRYTRPIAHWNINVVRFYDHICSLSVHPVQHEFPSQSINVVHFLTT